MVNNAAVDIGVQQSECLVSIRTHVRVYVSLSLSHSFSPSVCVCVCVCVCVGVEFLGRGGSMFNLLRTSPPNFSTVSALFCILTNDVDF
jgi:hypothetical protein